MTLAAGCTSVDETVPVAEGRTGAPADTGTFPNLNVPQQAAAPQLTQSRDGCETGSASGRRCPAVAR